MRSYSIIPMIILEHDHVWDSKWNFDKDAHWHECVAMYGKCDITDNTKKGGYQKHSYGKGKQIKLLLIRQPD